MASIDKIYGNYEQFLELKNFIALRYPEFLNYLYYHDDWEIGCNLDEIRPISNFPSRLDYQMMDDKNTPEFVQKRLKEQYSNNF